MGQYLIDNNVISSYFSDLFSEKAMLFTAGLIDSIPNVSVITQIEALSWIHSDENKEKIIQEFISDANILPLTSTIVSHCILIRRSKILKTPDAIIAATAVVHNLTLVTSDKDFKRIAGLAVIDPADL